MLIYDITIFFDKIKIVLKQWKIKFPNPMNFIMKNTFTIQLIYSRW